jgi:hypothetical protein
MINIYYHSIAFNKNPLWIKNFLTLEAHFFVDQLKLLKTLNFKSFFLQEYYQNLQGRIILPQKSIGIQFDDGYLDNWVFAFPLLQKFGLKATIFVSPEFVDNRNIEPRPNLYDYWNGKVSESELNKISAGFLNWEEMRLMEKSGVIDIQSHTMTHTKYPCGTKITGFHHPKADSVYTICNLFPEQKPYYITNNKFYSLIPYGTPLFEEGSSLVTKRHFYDDEIIERVVKFLQSKFKPEDYVFNTWYRGVASIIETFKKSGRSVVKYIEKDEEYYDRLKYEISFSKEIVERELNKTVDFICWPHGENNQTCHNMAITGGYKATSVGKNYESKYNKDRFDRIGLSAINNNRLFTILKAFYKLQGNRKKFPFFFIKRAYEKSKGYV